MTTKCSVCGMEFDLLNGCGCRDNRDYIVINVMMKNAGDDLIMVINAFDGPGDVPIYTDSVDIKDNKAIDVFIMVDRVKYVCSKLKCKFKCLLNNQSGVYTFMADKED